VPERIVAAGQRPAGWFKKTNMPCDDITPVELEGDHGTVKTA
jgi:hypothetical protein